MLTARLLLRIGFYLQRFCDGNSTVELVQNYFIDEYGEKAKPLSIQKGFIKAQSLSQALFDVVAEELNFNSSGYEVTLVLNEDLAMVTINKHKIPIFQKGIRVEWYSSIYQFKCFLQAEYDEFIHSLCAAIKAA